MAARELGGPHKLGSRRVGAAALSWDKQRVIKTATEGSSMHLSLAPIFARGMILQRALPACVWGTAASIVFS